MTKIGPDPPGYVPRRTSLYFIKCGDFVKIGISQSPKYRMRDIQSTNPLLCEMLHIVRFKSKRGALRLERQLHKKFSKDMVRGEWFNYTDAIKQEIDQLFSEGEN